LNNHFLEDINNIMNEETFLEQMKFYDHLVAEWRKEVSDDYDIFIFEAAIKAVKRDLVHMYKYGKRCD
jgi:hypothetical protein